MEERTVKQKLTHITGRCSWANFPPGASGPRRSSHPRSLARCASRWGDSTMEGCPRACSRGSRSTRGTRCCWELPCPGSSSWRRCHWISELLGGRVRRLWRVVDSPSRLICLQTNDKNED
ncbi:hypothetical protein CEXT_797841 [Caerostris extrusa]|uniref:Uncharacterized protein n=1 Tax=Caerostris extrusa TaxID=172846 RepID=A0AAV4SP44_CAEEX|nr:hypothetical protein CEXT_797841 [Caerostris extrusa]